MDVAPVMAPLHTTGCGTRRTRSTGVFAEVAGAAAALVVFLATLAARATGLPPREMLKGLEQDRDVCPGLRAATTRLWRL